MGSRCPDPLKIIFPGCPLDGLFYSPPTVANDLKRVGMQGSLDRAAKISAMLCPYRLGLNAVAGSQLRHAFRYWLAALGLSRAVDGCQRRP